jgi:hypothetical protein
MEITKVKIILRKYPKEFEWEGIEAWEKRINENIKDLEVVAVRPIGMDGVLIQFTEECPNNVKKIQTSYPISGTYTNDYTGFTVSSTSDGY